MNAQWKDRSGTPVESRSQGLMFEPLQREPEAIDIHARRYEVRYQRDLRADAAGLDWRLYAFGRGHWCECNHHVGTFRTEEEAHAVGRRWVATGRVEASTHVGEGKRAA